MTLEVSYVATTDLIPYANNPRTHSEQQVAQVAASIQEYGSNTKYDFIELTNICEEEIDMSILDEIDDEEVNAFEGDVKKAIQIEFEQEHYAEAQELIKFWRDNEAYIGYMIIQHLREQKENL